MLTLLHETSWVHLHPHFLPALAAVTLVALGVVALRRIRRDRAE